MLKIKLKYQINFQNIFKNPFVIKTICYRIEHLSFSLIKLSVCKLISLEIKQNFNIKLKIEKIKPKKRTL